MTIFQLHSEPVLDDWLDHYGHLNEAYYLVAFSNATWALQEKFGIGAEYFERTGGALYTVESHVRYLKEVRAPAVMEIATMILGVDAKRVHFAEIMTVDGIERATFECMGLHVDANTGRTAPIPEDVARAMTEAMVAETPDWAGQRVSL
ncbi:MAG: thioesterase family protein [Rhodospirillales bacterium]|nr:thioesterase family protein [Alphaproteobacteria bacterium]MBL6947634.1 thioesterase family protein [Rhodospirillales bacterium]